MKATKCQNNTQKGYHARKTAVESVSLGSMWVPWRTYAGSFRARLGIPDLTPSALQGSVLERRPSGSVPDFTIWYLSHVVTVSAAPVLNRFNANTFSTTNAFTLLLPPPQHFRRCLPPHPLLLPSSSSAPHKVVYNPLSHPLTSHIRPPFYQKQGSHRKRSPCNL